MTSLYYIIIVILFGIIIVAIIIVFFFFLPECICEVTRFRSFFFPFKACWREVARHLHTEKERCVGENGKTPALPVTECVWSQMQT